MKKRMLLSCFLAFVVIGPLGHFTHAGETKVATGNPAVQANNDFACDLYRNLDKDNQEKNLFFSPYSISSALAMTLEGARGETAEEMGKVMRLPASLRGGADAKTLPWKTGPYHLGFNALNRAFNTPTDELKDQAARQKLVDLRRQLDQANEQVRALEKKGKFNDPQLLKSRAQAKKLAEAINALNKQVDQFELRIANAIWGEKTYPFDPNYFDTISKYYGSGVLRNADFRGNFLGERDNINRWVLQQTKDRIKDLIPKLPPDVAKVDDVFVLGPPDLILLVDFIRSDHHGL